MKRAPRPENESERQRALEEFQVLDTPAEASYDKITHLAATICQTKISLVSLVDAERQWFKSSFGLQAKETPRDVSFCGHAIMGTDIFEVEDSAFNPDFCDNPLFLNEPNVRFYAGAPLITSKGYRIGTLCVIDSEPKKLNPMQREALKVLAAQVISLFELKLHHENLNLISQQLQEAQQIAKIGSWQFNLESGELAWSSEHYRIFEIHEPQPQNILFQMYRDRIHPEDLPILDLYLERALKHGEDFVFNHRVVLDDGKRIKYVQGIARVAKDQEGRPVLMSGTCRDRTQDVMNERQIEEQKVLLESVLNHLPNLVFVKDPKQGFRFTLLNRAGENLLGLSCAEFIKKSESNFFPKELSEKYNQLDHEIIKTGKPVKVDREILQTPQGERILKTEVIPTFKPDGTPDLLIGISTDITEEVALTKALENERAKALHSAKLASLGEMSAGIAHEINNPLAVISAAIQLLKKYKDDPVKFDAKVEAIQKASDRISKIVRGLRKFSRTSEGLEHKPEPIHQIILESVAMTEAKAHRSFTPVEIEIGTESEIHCDSVEIEQVLINLINNGIDAVKDLPEKWIKIRAFDEGSEVVLQVIDSGHGIAVEIEQKLFQPFFTTKVVGEGTGLGLSIAKGILDQHKAQLILNRQFRNTCFEVRFQRHTKAAIDAA